MKSIFPSFPYYFQNCFNKRVQFRLDNLLLHTLLLCMHVALSHSFGLQYIIFFWMPFTIANVICVTVLWTETELHARFPQKTHSAFTQCPPLHIALFNKRGPFIRIMSCWGGLHEWEFYYYCCSSIMLNNMCIFFSHQKKNGTFLYNITQHVLNGKFTS